MAEYLSPGVYVEDKVFGQQPITGGSASVGAFVGFAPRGKVGEPVLVTSWTDFVNKFALGAPSPYMENAYLSYAVYGFFNNGGRSAYILRVTDGSHESASIVVANTSGDINIFAKDPGAWGNRLSVRILQGETENTFIVEVYLNNVQVEVFRNVTLGQDNNIIRVINEGSNYIQIDTEATEFEPNVLNTMHQLTGGMDGLSNVQDNHIIESLNAFNGVDNINLLVIPESQSSAVLQAGRAYAESRKDCTFIADGKLNDDIEAIKQTRASIHSPSVVLYYPWIEVMDPIGRTSRTKFIPSAGHIAGVIARIDNERGIFKAPAGVEADVRGAVGVRRNVTDAEHDQLNPNGINVIRAFADVGIVVWGARTTANTYVNVERELKYIKRAILESTKWAVFEPNNPDLWRRLRNSVTDFLRGRYNMGAYKGETEDQAFFVKCDAELNPQSEIDAGRVNVEVGVAINKPGEFIIFRIGQWAGGQ